jgi:hypothetical protein
LVAIDVWYFRLIYCFVCLWSLWLSLIRTLILRYWLILLLLAIRLIRRYRIVLSRILRNRFIFCCVLRHQSLCFILCLVLWLWIVLCWIWWGILRGRFILILCCIWRHFWLSLIYCCICRDCVVLNINRGAVVLVDSSICFV